MFSSSVVDCADMLPLFVTTVNATRSVAAREASALGSHVVFVNVLVPTPDWLEPIIEFVVVRRVELSDDTRRSLMSGSTSRLTISRRHLRDLLPMRLAGRRHPD